MGPNWTPPTRPTERQASATGVAEERCEVGEVAVTAVMATINATGEGDVTGEGGVGGIAQDQLDDRSISYL